MNQEMKDALPDAGDKRWWKIDHAPKRRQQPITIELWEMSLRSRKVGARMIGFEYAVAQVADIALAAKTILERVADYEKVIGEYGAGDES